MQHDTYLEAKVLTAPPHQLHLMLIEGAIRYGRQAQEALLRGDFTTASEPLLRVLDIVGELLAGVRGQKTDLNIKIATFYLYLFRRVSEAKVNDDVVPLAEALELFEYERQTWQLVCDRLVSDDTGRRNPPQRVSVSHPQPTSPIIAPALEGISALPPSPGFSLEA